MCPHFEIAGLSINSFLLFNALGFLSGFILFGYRLRRGQFGWAVVFTFCGIILFGGIIGSKIYYLFEEPRLFLAAPLETLFSFSGSGWFGGFLMCMGLIALYSRRLGQPVLRMLDIIIPAVPLGIILGRFACFMAGDGCYGVPTDLPWGMAFPEGVMPTLLAVHPTPLYEIGANICILAVLLYVDRRSLPVGLLFGFYLVLSSIARFLVEFLRLNPLAAFGLTAPQLIAIGLFVAGVVLVVRRARELKPVH